MAKRSPTRTPYSPPVLKPDDLGITPPLPEKLLPDEPALVVALVNVDPAVLAGVKIGDLVTLRADPTSITVSTLAGQRLGDIAASEQPTIRLLGSTSGRVSQVAPEVPTCAIRIR